MKPSEKNFSIPAYDDSSLHQAESVLYGDKRLSAKMISELMHVDTHLPTIYEHEDKHIQREGDHTVVYYFLLIIASFIVASSIGLFFSYAHELGPFAQSSTSSL